MWRSIEEELGKLNISWNTAEKMAARKQSALVECWLCPLLHKEHKGIREGRSDMQHWQNWLTKSKHTYIYILIRIEAALTASYSKLSQKFKNMSHCVLVWVMVKIWKGLMLVAATDITFGNLSTSHHQSQVKCFLSVKCVKCTKAGSWILVTDWSVILPYCWLPEDSSRICQ